MRRFKDLPIKEKLRLAIMLACAILVGLSTLAFLVKDAVTAKAGMEQKYVSVSDIVADNIAPALVFQDPAAAGHTLFPLQRDPHILYAAVYAKDGSRFVDYASASSSASRRASGAAPATLPADVREACPSLTFGYDRLTICRPVELKGERVGTALMATALTPLYNQMYAVLGINSIVLAAALVLAFLISHPLASLLAGPAVRLTETIRRISERDEYGSRAVKEADDELGQLTDGFNKMLDQLQQRDDHLKRYNEDLEHLIAQRTAELEQSVEDLKAARDLAESASRAKSEFLSSMSHELRTPLTAVIGFSELMDMDPDFDAAHKENVREITRAGRHLLMLINDVIDLAKIEAGRLDVSLAAVPIAAVFEECEPLVQPLARTHDIALQFMHDSCAGLAVKADFTRLRQVILNLTSNAIKYNRPNGRVKIYCEPVERRRLRIYVEDTGRGIPEQRMHELFEPFNRLGAEMGPVEGTGIGLVITKRLTEMMGGKLGLASTQGEGSTFWVDLDLAATAPAVDSTSTGERGDESGGAHVPTDGPARSALHDEDNAVRRCVACAEGILLRATGHDSAPA
jgi:signal transduction histidine kinase